MKNIVKLILAAFLFLNLSSLSIAEEAIRISTGEWPPYISKDLKYYGVVSRIVKEAFELEDIRVEFGFFPWKRAYAEVKTGESDASSIYYYHKDRAKFCDHSDPVFSAGEVFFHLKSYVFNWNDWADLKGLQIGATLGYTHLRILKEKLKIVNFDLQTRPTDEMNIKKLLHNRIQIFPCEKGTFYYLMNTLFTPEDLNRITYHPKFIFQEGLFLLFSKKHERNKRLIKSFNMGLKKLKQNGKYDQYFGESLRGEYIVK